MVDHKKQFISIFNETARYHHRNKVFRDFITLAAASIHNGINCNDELENEYMETVSQYEAKDAERMAMLLAEVVMGLEAGSGDFLGSLYMTLELGEAARGQFFTPFCVSRMMAEMQLGDIDSLLADKPFFTVYEPACGSAGMLLAIAEVLREKGFNPTRRLWVSCTDIDTVASGMAYIQLSLMGVAGEVVTGNALNGERRRVMYTPAHWIGNWSLRLRKTN
ncbi:N-6 DNA methylase [Obesumbacterium proteus]|uniref:site-specific DNA-methyltransferase (adenine-specific) n=1 Tax=Obesumbacterium proteus ATCC 12841 TaxID=1354268 RepID=A0AA91IPL2_9GAMM|nr:integrase [Obesumbacterium proteus]OAT58897.1 type I restriction-modification system methyltransferase subunit [Obesumbacterium proteus ATCC 12841]